MSWFKKIVNRFFTENEEPELNDYENKENNLKNENDRLQMDSQSHLDNVNERPTFRFPIITDAEIYGWEEPTEERMEPTIASTDELDDDFEPVPLYEHERWPGRDEAHRNVYRADSSRKGLTSVTNEKSPTYSEEPFRTKDDDQESVFSPPKWSERFTPSTVASPIHGFTWPKQTVVREVNGDVKLIAEEKAAVFTEVHPDKGEQVEMTKPSPQNEKELSEKVSSFEEAVEIKLDPKENTSTEIVDEVSTTNLPADDLKQQEVKSKIEKENEIEQSNEITDKPQHEIEAVSIEKEFDGKDSLIIQSETSSNVQTEELPVEKVELVSEQEISVAEPEEEQQQTKTKSSLPIQSTVVKNNDEDLNLEETKEESTNDSTHSQLEEPKKEKIVPFNVLMLKSDKEKLAKSLKSHQEPSVEPQKKLKGKLQKEPRKEEVQTPSTLESKQETPIIEEVEEQHYVFPPSEYLIPPEAEVKDQEWLDSQSEKLEESLSHFGVQATVLEAVQGPTVTRFELTVGQGTKVSRVRNLTDDLKLALAAKEIRIQAPIPGRSSIGIEIPNRQTRPVRISEVIETEAFKNSTSPLEAVLGLSLTGKPITLDLRKMPHGMIAGATGSGKSVCINSILVSLLYKANPTELKLMLIDPKMVELAPFNGIPHLISPVITDVKAANAALKWAVAEMERRYELLAHAGVRDIERYNKVVLEEGKHSLKMPYLLIVIDELSDLMMMAPQDVEVSISRIAQKARACGIHLIIATQRPSVDVITGTIKANIPTRIAFAVSSQVDSRTIVDTAGAERLLGKGDMLYIGNGQSSAVRLQGTFVTDDEIERIIEHVQHEASPTYLFGQDELLKRAVEEEEKDPLFEETCLFVYEQGSASTSLLQRNFSIGYNRAAKLMDRMEKRGYISEQRGSRPRDVYLTESDFEQLTT